MKNRQKIEYKQISFYNIIYKYKFFKDVLKNQKKKKKQSSK